MLVVVYPQAPFPPQYWRVREREALDVQSQPEGGTAEPRDGWQPRPLPRFKLPQGVSFYYWSAPDAVSSAPPEAEGFAAWNPPRTFIPLPQIFYGFGGLRAETSETAPDQAGLEGKYAWKPRPLGNTYAAKSWLFIQNIAQDTSAPLEAEGMHGWSPRPLWQYGKRHPIWGYLQETSELSSVADTGTRYQIFWQYPTEYGMVAAFQRHLSHRGEVFSSLSEGTLLSWVPRPIPQFVLNRQIPYSYWLRAYGTDSAPIEPETLLSWIPRPLRAFVLPHGVALYYQSNTAQDFSVPVSAQVVGRVTGLEHRPVHWPTVIR